MVSELHIGIPKYSYMHVYMVLGKISWVGAFK